MIFAICFTNFGPYHLARLRALASRLGERGDCLIAYEMAATERTYPWQRPQQARAVRLDYLVPEPGTRSPDSLRLRHGHRTGTRP